MYYIANNNKNVYQSKDFNCIRPRACSHDNTFKWQKEGHSPSRFPWEVKNNFRKLNTAGFRAFFCSTCFSLSKRIHYMNKILPFSMISRKNRKAFNKQPCLFFAFLFFGLFLSLLLLFCFVWVCFFFSIVCVNSFFFVNQNLFWKIRENPVLKLSLCWALSASRLI